MNEQCCISTLSCLKEETVFSPQHIKGENEHDLPDICYKPDKVKKKQWISFEFEQMLQFL